MFSPLFFLFPCRKLYTTGDSLGKMSLVYKMFSEEDQIIVYDNINSIISKIYSDIFYHQLRFLNIKHYFHEKKIIEICKELIKDNGILEEYQESGIDNIDLIQTIFVLSHLISKYQLIELKRNDSKNYIVEYADYVATHANEYLAVAVAQGIYYDRYGYIAAISKKSMESLINALWSGIKEDIYFWIHRLFQSWD